MRIDERAIELYGELFTLQMIGDFFGVTRQGVGKYLKRHGVDTSNKGGYLVTCAKCGVEFKKARCQIRKRIKNYCSVGCYYGELENPDYKRTATDDKRGSREARRVVRQFRGLFEDEVVHHIDSDTGNNDANNLLVFKDQADHMRWHRAGKVRSGVVPVWPESAVDESLSEKYKRLNPKKRCLKCKKFNRDCVC